MPLNQMTKPLKKSLIEWDSNFHLYVIRVYISLLILNQKATMIWKISRLLPFNYRYFLLKKQGDFSTKKKQQKH